MKIRYDDGSYLGYDTEEKPVLTDSRGAEIFESYAAGLKAVKDAQDAHDFNGGEFSFVNF